MKTLICVVYDSINNSVFQSQILAPLLMRKKEEPKLNINIISFEKDIQIEVPKRSDITFYIFKRYPFVHNLALFANILRLKNLLRNFASYELLARGPFAGYIAYYGADKGCNKITVQARGLAAEEYAYTICSEKKTFLQRLRYNRFLELEKKVYSINNPIITFEAVSPALKQYLSFTFGTKSESITVATKDIPQMISTKQKKRFRKKKRTELHIPQEATVYCYSGSYKPWQCPDETITYFKHEHIKNNQAVLLILTADIGQFKISLEKAAIPAKSYRIKSVPQPTLLEYLSAADFGLLLRKKHIINFVSRPTKALEYNAAGLTILHNNTIPYVKNLPKSKSIIKNFILN